MERILQLTRELELRILSRNEIKSSIKRIVLFLIALSFSFLSNGQHKWELDSLQKLDIENYPDSLAVEIYTTLANRLNEPRLKEKYAILLLNRSKSGDHVSKMRANLYLGNAKKSTSDFEDALHYYLNSLEIAQKIGDKQVGIINLTIADTYKGVANYSNANKYYRDALNSLSNKRKSVIVDSLYLIGVYINYGDLYLVQEEFDSALFYFKKADELGTHLKNHYYLAAAKGNIAIVYAEMGQDQYADLEIKKCIDQLLNKELWDIATDFLTYLIDIYKEKGNHELAMKYAFQMRDIALKYGLKKRSESANLKLYEIMQAKGDYQSALAYHKKYVAYKDSVLNLETVQKMADQRTEFEVGQKQAEVDLLTAEKKIQQFIIWSTAGGAFLVALLLAVVYRNSREKNRINKILEEQKAQLEELNNTKDKLFSIISHDLRGPVHAFSGISRLIKYAVEDESQDDLIEIADHVEKTSNDLSGLLDGLLSWALQQQGNFSYTPEKLELGRIAEDINGIFLYTSKAKKIPFTIDVDKNHFLWTDKNTTLTILRNLVNNAFKFTEEGGEVSLKTRETGEYILITVSDTGIGIPEEKLNTLFKMDGSKTSYGTSGEKGLGLGLQLVYEFVAMNKGTVEVESEVGNWTQFIVKLPKYSAQEVN